MDALKILSIIGYVLPLINSVIQIVEGFPALSGEQKKTQSILLMKSIYTGLQDPKVAKIKEIQVVPFEAFEPVLSLVIDSVVRALNAAGVKS